MTKTLNFCVDFTSRDFQVFALLLDAHVGLAHSFIQITNVFQRDSAHHPAHTPFYRDEALAAAALKK